MYRYETEKNALFTKGGQRLFLGIRDQTQRLLKIAGAVRMQEAIALPPGISADSWTLLACVDRLVELGELREVGSTDVAGQYRVFVSGRKR
jgi:hypothetical protein